MSSMNIESVQETELNHDEYATTTTAHTVNKDSWQQVGLLLATSFNCAYVFSFSNLLIVPLGWFWGLVCLFTIAGFSFYANCLLADFHVIDGQRFIRFRDLMGFAYGKKLYYSTWFFQFVTLILGNMSFILLGGRALKAINSEFTDDPLRLQVFICITGLVYCIFSYLVPTISDMRNWIAVSLVLTTTYIVTLMSIVIKDGASNKSRDYNLEGNTLEKFFRAFGAIAATLVASNAGMVPELQVRAKTATRKAKAWHWSIIIVAQALSVISSASSFRLISDNARKYKFFADT